MCDRGKTLARKAGSPYRSYARNDSRDSLGPIMADSVGVGRAQGITMWWFASHSFVSHRVKDSNKGS